MFDHWRMNPNRAPPALPRSSDKFVQEDRLISFLRCHTEARPCKPRPFSCLCHSARQLPRVLEAISEGVSFTSMEHSASADSLVVLRPRLSKRDAAYALLRAFGYARRPYDFDFDFQTDSSLVCTELIYKAYEPAAPVEGIRMQPEEIVGRLAIPANSIARQFDVEYAAPAQQWDMVLFLDGSEREKRALESDATRFRDSWRRPKWHVLLPDAQQARADTK